MLLIINHRHKSYSESFVRQEGILLILHGLVGAKRVRPNTKQMMFHMLSFAAHNPVFFLSASLSIILDDSVGPHLLLESACTSFLSQL